MSMFFLVEPAGVVHKEFVVLRMPGKQLITEALYFYKPYFYRHNLITDVHHSSAALHDIAAKDNMYHCSTILRVDLMSLTI